MFDDCRLASILAVLRHWQATHAYRHLDELLADWLQFTEPMPLAPNADLSSSVQQRQGNTTNIHHGMASNVQSTQREWAYSLMQIDCTE